jgi:RTX calcium-binding nonapeptide repeat (4 copies)/FG-GAP repeat
MPFNPVLNLGTLNGTNGFRLDGAAAFETSGISVASAGDVNNDGFDDLIVGAYQASPGGIAAAGSSYVVFGKAGGWTATTNLSTLNGTNGFRLDGVATSDVSGFSVASAGDLNGDGFDDLIVGAFGADLGAATDTGSSYVVFGKATGWAATTSLSALNGTNGFRLDGFASSDNSGYSVASAGDLNGDGFDDLIVGAYGADPGGTTGAGSSYVVFGKAGGWTATANLSTLNGTNGFRLDGVGGGDSSGVSVASAGDINKDGFDDLIIGAYAADPGGTIDAGSSYVVFGKATGWTATTNLSTLNGANGFRLDGISAGDLSGISVASAGDVNGDGFDDVVVGAFQADPSGNPSAGSSYVVFGKAGGWANTNNLFSLMNGTNGFRLDGGAASDTSGLSVASAGDINGDGFDDLIVGAYGADPVGNSSAGSSYVVFGKSGGWAATTDLSTLNGTNGFRLDGVAADENSGISVASAGDVNNDGFDDLIVGAYQASSGGIQSAGSSYVVFGKATGAINRFGTAAGEFMAGGEFDDTLSGLGGSDTLRGNAGIDNLFGGDGADFLYGGSGEDVLYGESDIDLLAGGDNADRLLGGAGNDNLYGEAGDDVMYGEADNDFMSGSAGNDQMFGGAGNDNVYGEAGIDDLSGGAGTDTLVGGGGDDVISGGADADQIYGEGGNDVLNGDAGIDFIAGGVGDDQIDGGTEGDQLFGEGGFDQLSGGDGVDYLDGGVQDDVLIGGAGNDTLLGNTGRDQLTGGTGQDYFAFGAVNHGGDSILDFTTADADRIYIFAAGFGGGLAAGALAANRFVSGTNPLANQAFGQFLYNTATGQLSFDADGTGGLAAQELSTVFAPGGVAATLTAADFLLF